jgi:hypothetical protein
MAERNETDEALDELFTAKKRKADSSSPVPRIAFYIYLSSPYSLS